jgi:hypothetical protein
MNARIKRYLAVGFSALCLAVAQPFGHAAELGDGDVLAEIRSALASRDLPVAKAKLTEAAKTEGDEAFTSERDRLQSLYQHLEEFWKAVDEAAKSLEATEELMVGEIRVAVVEYEPGLLVLRVNGQNRRYTVKTLPAAVALTLAKRVLKPEAPVNKVLFGRDEFRCGRTWASGRGRVGRCRWRRSCGSTARTGRPPARSAAPPSARWRCAAATPAAGLAHRIAAARAASGRRASRRPSAPAAAGFGHPASRLASDTGRPRPSAGRGRSNTAPCSTPTCPPGPRP